MFYSSVKVYQNFAKRFCNILGMFMNLTYSKISILTRQRVIVVMNIITHEVMKISLTCIK